MLTVKFITATGVVCFESPYAEIIISPDAVTKRAQGFIDNFKLQAEKEYHGPLLDAECLLDVSRGLYCIMPGDEVHIYSQGALISHHARPW